MEGRSVSIVESKTQKIIEAINTADAHYNIVILYGPHGIGKTNILRNVASSNGIKYINIGEHLAELIKDISPATRVRNVQPLLESMLETNTTNIIDDTEILFNKDLNQNIPLLLRNIGRKRTAALVISIPGVLKDGKLIFSEAPYWDAAQYDMHDFTLVNAEKER